MFLVFDLVHIYNKQCANKFSYFVINYLMIIFSFIRHKYHYNYQLFFLLRCECNRLHDVLCKSGTFIDVQGNKFIAFIFLCTNLSKKSL